MIFYVIYTLLVAMLIVNASPLFTPIFDAIGVADGFRTVIIQISAVGVSGLVVMINRRPHPFLKEVTQVILIWLPFVAYLAMRTNFDDHYAATKFWKIVLIPIVSAVTVTAMYLVGGEKFNKCFIFTLVSISLLQLFEALNNPAVFLYGGKIERLTIDEVNPIWLARSFVTAAILCLSLPITKFRLAKIVLIFVLITAVLPTGSRGPLIAAVLGFCLFLWQYSRKKPYFGVKVVGMFSVALVVLLVSLPYIEAPLANYMDRDSEKGAFQESGRAMLFSKAWTEFRDSPVFGQGVGNFSRDPYPKSFRIGNQEGYYPHNLILEIMCELGTVGLAFFVIAMRPGKHYWHINNIYQILFIVSFIFAMTSGSIAANGGVLVFGVLARLAYKYNLEILAIEKNAGGGRSVGDKI
ncbi:MAG: O-antigen ligase family protein [Nitrospira sp.]|nr:O-antigen ligase family protein [Nitrospira sp.]